MSEQQDALEDLERAGVLAGIAWGAASTYARTMSDYDPEAGHDQGWVGYTAHGFLRDRLDRVFSCGKYTVGSSGDEQSGLDTVAAGLLEGEFDLMPRLSPGTVVRANLNGSPGWRFGDWRWLLASFRYGESDDIPWSQKSPTKRRVASQPLPDQPMLPLGEDELHLLSDVVEELTRVDEGDLTTLVVAHSIHKEREIQELFLGRSRLSNGSESAWHWKHDLLASPPGNFGARPKPAEPEPSSGSDAEPDAKVRLRRQTQEGDGT